MEKIEALPADQRQQLADWLLSGLTLDQVVEKAQADFGAEIPRTTLHSPEHYPIRASVPPNRRIVECLCPG